MTRDPVVAFGEGVGGTRLADRVFAETATELHVQSFCARRALSAAEMLLNLCRIRRAHISVVLATTLASESSFAFSNERQVAFIIDVVLCVVSVVALMHFPGVLGTNRAGFADFSMAVGGGERSMTVHFAAAVALGVVRLGAGEGDAEAFGADGAATAEFGVEGLVGGAR